jgi:hypothetical protein
LDEIDLKEHFYVPGTRLIRQGRMFSNSFASRRPVDALELLSQLVVGLEMFYSERRVKGARMRRGQWEGHGRPTGKGEGRGRPEYSPTTTKAAANPNPSERG